MELWIQANLWNDLSDWNVIPQMCRAAGSPWVHSSPSHCWVTISKIKGRTLFFCKGKIIGSPEVGMRTRSLSGWPKNSIGAWAASGKDEKREEKKEAVKRCKRREVDCLSALVARIVKTAQQSCAAVAVVHGNALELILLGGPIRWKRRLHQGKSEGTLHPANIWEEWLLKRSHDRRKRSDRADLLPPPSILLVFLLFQASLGTSRD